MRQSKHIVMSDGARFLTIPRHNPVNAFTMGGIVRDAGLTEAGLQKAALIWRAVTSLRSGFLPDHLHHTLRELVRDRDRQVVVRDLPRIADHLPHDAAAAALAVRRAVELFVEPGDVASMARG